MKLMSGTPRVELDEVDLSNAIPAIGTSTSASVIEAQRGEVNQRVFVPNYTDFINRFGDVKVPTFQEQKNVDETLLAQKNIGIVSAKLQFNEVPNMWIVRATTGGSGLAYSSAALNPEPLVNYAPGENSELTLASGESTNEINIGSHSELFEVKTISNDVTWTVSSDDNNGIEVKTEQANTAFLNGTIGVPALGSSDALRDEWADGYTFENTNGAPGIRELEEIPPTESLGIIFGSKGPGIQGNNIAISVQRAPDLHTGGDKATDFAKLQQMVSDPFIPGDEERKPISGRTLKLTTKGYRGNTSTDSFVPFITGVNGFDWLNRYDDAPIIRKQKTLPDGETPVYRTFKKLSNGESGEFNKDWLNNHRLVSNAIPTKAISDFIKKIVPFTAEVFVDLLAEPGFIGADTDIQQEMARDFLAQRFGFVVSFRVRETGGTIKSVGNHVKACNFDNMPQITSDGSFDTIDQANILFMSMFNGTPETGDLVVLKNIPSELCGANKGYASITIDNVNISATLKNIVASFKNLYELDRNGLVTDVSYNKFAQDNTDVVLLEEIRDCYIITIDQGVTGGGDGAEYIELVRSANLGITDIFDSLSAYKTNSYQDIDLNIMSVYHYEVPEEAVWSKLFKICVYQVPNNTAVEDFFRPRKREILEYRPGTGGIVAGGDLAFNSEVDVVSQNYWDRFTPTETFICSFGDVLDSNNINYNVMFQVNGSSDYIYVSRSANIGMELDDLPDLMTQIRPLRGAGDIQINRKVAYRDKLAAWRLLNSQNKATFSLAIIPDIFSRQENFDEIKSYVNGVAEICIGRQDAILCVTPTMIENTSPDAAFAKGQEFGGYSNESYVVHDVGFDRFFDGTLGRVIWVPKSTARVLSCARVSNSGNVWDAPAGIPNGAITYSAGSTPALDESTYARFYDNNLNSSLQFNGGQFLWGQKTAQLKHSALDRISTRRMLIYVQQTMKEMLKPYLFNISNNETSRFRVESDLRGFLTLVGSSGGFQQFDVIIDPTINNPPAVVENNQLNVAVTIVPNYIVEYINLKTVILSLSISQSGVDITESLM